jgi:hypothetical protein
MSAVTTEKKTSDKPGAFSARETSSNGRERLAAKEKETGQVGPRKTIIREYFESAVVTVIMALFGMTFIVQAVKVPYRFNAKHNHGWRSLARKQIRVCTWAAFSAVAAARYSTRRHYRFQISG